MRWMEGVEEAKERQKGSLREGFKFITACVQIQAKRNAANPQILSGSN